MIIIDVLNEQQEKNITDKEQDLIKELIIIAADMEEIDDGEVVVTLVDNQRIQELNRDYRQMDQPTDVLSFAMNEQGDEEMDIIYEEELPNTLGDIVISIPRAMEQAEEYGHSFERELGFLTVHGFLHLIGYDHQTEEEEKEMFSKQNQALAKLQLLR